MKERRTQNITKLLVVEIGLFPIKNPWNFSRCFRQECPDSCVSGCVEPSEGEERLTLHREQPCIAGGYPYLAWSWASRVLRDSKEPRSLQQSRQWKTATWSRQWKTEHGAEEAKPQGSSDFLPPWDPEGTVKTSLQCKSLFKKQLSYWSKTRCRTKGFHYKETVSREDFFIKHFLFLISLILSFVCFKIFILAHVVMQPFSTACKIHHGSWGSCSEKQVRTNPHPGTGQPMQILMTSRQSGSSFRRSRISDEETNY